MAGAVRNRAKGALSLIAALVLVGLLTMGTPARPPDKVTARPDREGIVHTDRLVASVDSTGVTGAVAAPSRTVYSTQHRFVVVRWRAAAVGDIVAPIPGLTTRDGYAYRAYHRLGLTSWAEVRVGQALVHTTIFEVPADKIPGAVFTLEPELRTDVRTLTAVATFPLEELPSLAEPFAVPLDVTEAAP